MRAGDSGSAAVVSCSDSHFWLWCAAVEDLSIPGVGPRAAPNQHSSHFSGCVAPVARLPTTPDKVPYSLSAIGNPRFKLRQGQPLQKDRGQSAPHLLAERLSP